jgi:hypothetical protein
MCKKFMIASNLGGHVYITLPDAPADVAVTLSPSVTYLANLKPTHLFASLR